MARKITPVKYTDRDFESIKASIIEHAKRYYANSNSDFNEASFGTMMIDAVSYIGDVLSFYLDYQTNESFLETATEFNNVVKLARQAGYKFKENYSASGVASLFAVVPRSTSGTGPDYDYAPVLKAGSLFASTGDVTFTLLDDVDFSKAENRVVTATVDSLTGEALTYVIRAYGRVISGFNSRQEIEVGAYEPLRKIDLNVSNISEIVSVVDSEGHEYHEVEYLSQDVIFEQIANRSDVSSNAPRFTLRPKAVPRRFVTEYEVGKTIMQFGFGSDSTLQNDPVTDVSTAMLKIHGRNYTQTENFDPSNLMQTDKLGISPANTTLTVRYRVNSRSSVNTPSETLTIVTSPVLEFKAQNLSSAKVSAVTKSIEINNEEDILGDIDVPTVEEVRRRALDAHAAQNRAVTAQDYSAIIYRMPPKYGAIKRCKIAQDKDSIKRNLNIYLVSEASNGTLTTTNSTVKENVKFWVNQYKMINDTIDIMDARIVNIAINFSVRAAQDFNKFEVLDRCRESLVEYISDYQFDIGEPLYITNLYNALKTTIGVDDVLKVQVLQANGSDYSDTTYNVKENTSADGRLIYVPEDTVLEVKYLNNDIVGVVK
jgi:hypothetical protein